MGKKKLEYPISKAGAVFLIISGILLGTVFTVGMGYWNARVTKEEAIRADAAFSSCMVAQRSGHVKEIMIRFTDHEQLTIEGACLSDGVISEVEALKPGTVLHLYIHPNSNTILEMANGENMILGFEEAVGKLSAEASGFAMLGIFMYICAALGVVELVRKK